ncbi:MAG TPA: hypothetical protein VN901_02225 [Candidatus Acidoferrales bacterium]|nr:hypothetical protein [Candidatus Acidoferrales bacterium]
MLHRAHRDTGEVQEMYGIRVTHPLRTIVDLLRSGHVDRSRLKQASTKPYIVAPLEGEKSIACRMISCNLRLGTWPPA